MTFLLGETRNDLYTETDETNRIQSRVSNDGEKTAEIIYEKKNSNKNNARVFQKESCFPRRLPLLTSTHRPETKKPCSRTKHEISLVFQLPVNRKLT